MGMNVLLFLFVLQNQIAAQQAIYVKQQHQQHIAAQGPQTGDFFKPPMPDPMTALHGNFGELSMKEPQVSFASFPFSFMIGII